MKISALTFGLLLCLAMAARAAEPTSPDSAGPDFGVGNPTSYTLGAWSFQPLEDGMLFQPTSPGSSLRYCASSTSGYPKGYLEAGVHLPTGAVIDHVQTAGCDDGSMSMTTTLYYTSDPGSPSVVLDQFVPLPGGGCFYGGSNAAPINHTVDNTLYSYAIEVGFPIGNVGESLRSVRIYYHLQVSEAPASATFNDVPTSHPFFQYVEALAASGITGGCGSGNYCPDQPLTRGQMAVFLAKALGLHFSF
jgi:hypothetical protein